MSSRAKIAAAAAVLGLAIVAGVLSTRPERGPAESIPEPPELRRDQLELRDGVLYALGAPAPFDGVMAESFSDGTKRVAIEIRAGKPHGLSRGWHENGQLEVEEQFVAGVSHGLRTRWYASGSKKSEAHIVDGKIEGVFTRWHENGPKAAVVRMVGGVPHGLSEAWHPSGARKSRAVLDAGEVVSREFFDDDETL